MATKKLYLLTRHCNLFAGYKRGLSRRWLGPSVEGIRSRVNQGRGAGVCEQQGWFPES